jgi:hypothetical protein
MHMDRRGREWVSWDIDGPAGDVEVTFDGATWHPLERDQNTVRILVAGPDATGNPAGTVALPLGRSLAVLRLVDNPEVLVRRAGPIDVVTYQPAPTP